MTLPTPEPRLDLISAGHPLKRVEHYALALLNGITAGGSAGLSDADIDYAIDVAERLALKLAERGHISPQE